MCLFKAVESPHWPEQGQEEASPLRPTALLFIPVTQQPATPRVSSIPSHSLLKPCLLSLFIVFRSCSLKMSICPLCSLFLHFQICPSFKYLQSHKYRPDGLEQKLNKNPAIEERRHILGTSVFSSDVFTFIAFSRCPYPEQHAFISYTVQA